MLYVIKREKGPADKLAVHWVKKVDNIPHQIGGFTDVRGLARKFTRAEAALALAEIERMKPGSGRFTLIEDKPDGKVLGVYGTPADDLPPRLLDADDLAGLPDDAFDVGTSVAGYSTVGSQPEGSPFRALAATLGLSPNVESVTLDEVGAAAVDAVTAARKAVETQAKFGLAGTVNGVTFGVDGSDAFAHFGPNIMDGTASFTPVKDHPTPALAVMFAVTTLLLRDGQTKAEAAAKLATNAKEQPPQAKPGNTPAAAANVPTSKPAATQGKEAGK